VSERMTMVFDDEALARRLRVRAAESGVPIKRIIEDALREYLGPETAAPKLFDWDAYDRWTDEVRELPEEPGTPTDLSNVKEYLYGYEHSPRPVTMVAEERAEYDAGQP